MTGSIRSQLEANAAARGDAVWLTSPDTGDTVTWADALDASTDIARRLDSLGLAPGAPVAVAADHFPRKGGKSKKKKGATPGGKSKKKAVRV